MKTKLLFLIGLTLVGQVLLQEDTSGGGDGTTSGDQSGASSTVVVVPVDGGGATPSGQVQNQTLGDLNA